MKKIALVIKFCTFCFTILLLAGSCRPENKLARWEIDALTPLVNSRLEPSDILEDSVYTISADGGIIIEYRRQLGDFKFDRITEGFSKSFENTVKLENIDLGSRTVSNQISLGTIAAKAGVTGALLIANNGNNASVPPINGIGPETFRFDATEYFESITLDDGWLIIRIQNGLPIDLTNVQYSMMNQSGGAAITQNTINSIPTGATVIDSVRLNNRVTLEGKLMAVLQNLDSPGSNGNNVLIDTSDVINVQVSISDLKPYSATAIFPDQILIRDTTDTEVENFNGQLTSMVVDRGTIYLEANSTIEDVLEFQYRVPSARQNGIELQFTELVPPAPPGGFSNHYAEKSLINYAVNLQGRPGETGVYNTFYTITNGRIDSSGNLINLSLEDSVFLETGVKDLIASRAYGYLGKDTLSVQDNEEFSFFRQLRGGEINFAELNLQLQLENYIGAPLSLQLDAIRGFKGNNSLDLSWSALGNKHILPPAEELIPGNRPKAGVLNLPLNKTNSNINPFFNFHPDALALELSAYLNEAVSSPDYNQFVYLEHGIQAYLSMEIPLNISASEVTFNDTSSFNYRDLDPNDRLQSGKLILIGDNYFPFDVEVEILLLDKDSVLLETLRSETYLEAGLTDMNGLVIEGTESLQNFELTPTVISALRDTRHLVFQARFNSANYPALVVLQAENYLDLTLSADIKVNSR